ncbi:6-phospho-3-hexuloisomerase [Mucilaginibacter polytrichastri]|uniref:3-hexulose-6-phosphate isomerase n=1 Tax=Mucilaginibacter polytrichastri TaxID=1302689 RepID=A0A1Q5ZXM4_9SPHI|nr:6-phospho-3-hexuloisomerase [Mucilaginibacter polytrichastri]OKS86492.1 3-hexulose-6-phosphate isomerase [Mucilaginibacter polytrichastri]SFS78937.1 3-hexulose-6-phosphate isomerase [Mucilaginibacter polytrichastri]
MDLTRQQDLTQANAIKANLTLVLDENKQLAERIDYDQFVPMLTGIQQANSIFLIASGRSGFSMRSFAMRLMHLGLQVYFVGDTTTPAIKPGDVLLAASGSGTTGTVVKAAQKAKDVGAKVITITTNPSSPLAALSDTHIYVPAAEKEDHHGGKSQQYAGSLFEQAVLLITDAVFLELWRIDGTPAEELWKRHANME